MSWFSELAADCSTGLGLGSWMSEHSSVSFRCCHSSQVCKAVTAMKSEDCRLEYREESAQTGIEGWTHGHRRRRGREVYGWCKVLLCTFPCDWTLRQGPPLGQTTFCWTKIKQLNLLPVYYNKYAKHRTHLDCRYKVWQGLRTAAHFTQQPTFATTLSNQWHTWDHKWCMAFSFPASSCPRCKQNLFPVRTYNPSIWNNALSTCKL